MYKMVVYSLTALISIFLVFILYLNYSDRLYKFIAGDQALNQLEPGPVMSPESFNDTLADLDKEPVRVIGAKELKAINDSLNVKSKLSEAEKARIISELSNKK